MQHTTLIVPGFHGSGPAHWQSWFEARLPDARRVIGIDWEAPVLARWAGAVRDAIDRAPGPVWVVAHSFGCLTTAHSLARDPQGVAGVLLVGPADPEKFGVADNLPHKRLPCPGILIASQTDPWMKAEHAAQWARRWNCKYIDGCAGP